MLFPLLEEIAREQRNMVTIYKIDIDKNPDIAMAFGVSKRPYVVFIKNQKEVHAIAGVQPKDTFVSAIEMCAIRK
jgi:thioredoxin 1